MTEKREPLPDDLHARIMDTGQMGVLAGCTADEVIALCKATIRKWMRDNPDAARRFAS